MTDGEGAPPPESPADSGPMQIGLRTANLFHIFASTEDDGTQWNFPVYCEMADVWPQKAMVIVGDAWIPLTNGQQQITGTGADVSVSVDLGTAQGFKCFADPFNQANSLNEYPIQDVVLGPNAVWLQIANNGPLTPILLLMNLDLEGVDEVQVLLEADTTVSVPVGDSQYNGAAETLAFHVEGWSGDGVISLAYEFPGAFPD